LSAEDGAPAYYDAYWERENWSTSPPLKLRELFMTHVRSSDECLDVGCGDGGTSGVWLSEHADSYVGVDIAESALRLARERGLDVRPISDGSDLPFPDGSFDFAVCVEVLEHLFEPQAILAEIRRVLRRNGRLIVTVPNAAHWRNRIDVALLGRWNPRGDDLSASQPWRDPHLRFFTVRSLANLIEHCGFEILESGGFAEHGFSHYIPRLRDLARSPLARPTGRRLAGAFPTLLAGSAYVVGQLQAA